MVKPCSVPYKKPYLHKVIIKQGQKNGNSMVITHEQWVLTSFLSLDSLALILGNFHIFWDNR
jgi:hypothetical protein